MGAVEWFLTAFLVGRLWRLMSRKGAPPMVKTPTPTHADEIDVALNERRAAWHRHIVEGNIKDAIDDVREMDRLLDERNALKVKART